MKILLILFVITTGLLSYEEFDKDEYLRSVNQTIYEKERKLYLETKEKFYDIVKVGSPIDRYHRDFYEEDDILVDKDYTDFPPELHKYLFRIETKEELDKLTNFLTDDVRILKSMGERYIYYYFNNLSDKLKNIDERNIKLVSSCKRKELSNRMLNLKRAVPYIEYLEISSNQSHEELLQYMKNKKSKLTQYIQKMKTCEEQQFLKLFVDYVGKQNIDKIIKHYQNNPKFYDLVTYGEQ